jgi:lipoate-protein ligase B
MRVLRVCDLGPTSYRDGLRLQESLVRARVAARERGEQADWLLFPEHPPVLTVGRSTRDVKLRVPAEAIAARGLEVFEVARGGDITWHGPGQLVGYPICDLDAHGHDLHRFLRELEQTMLDVAARWGIEARRVAGRTGIWVGAEKLASIGVAVRRWVTYHGFALNVHPDLSDFELIDPCGLAGVRMTSFQRLLGEGAPTLEEARRAAAEAVAARLGHDRCEWVSPAEAWRAAAEAPGLPTPSRDGAAGGASNSVQSSAA